MIELQDIVKKYGEVILLPVQHKALRSICDCRTSALSGHVDHFDCGHTHISYNSCRNRNCPKCQSLAKEQWVAARMEDLLPIPYYHVVFTLPEELNRLAFINIAALYDLLMNVSSETLKELYKDSSKSKIMKLTSEEFLRRFLLHVLPSGFRKIRYYGSLAPPAKKTKLLLCKKLLGVKISSEKHSKISTRDLMLKLTGKDIFVCPVCSMGKLINSSGLHPPASSN